MVCYMMQESFDEDSRGGVENTLLSSMDMNPVWIHRKVRCEKGPRMKKKLE